MIAEDEPSAEALARADSIITTWDDLNPAFSMRELLAIAIDAAYRRGVEDAQSDADNYHAYIESLKRAVQQLCEIIGVERGTDNWPEFVLRARAALALALTPPQEES